MNRELHLQAWDMMRMRHGIGLRVAQMLPADQLDATPIPGMRSAKDLLVHMYGSIVRSLAEAPLKGTAPGVDEPAVVASLKTREALVAYIEECWKAANAAALAVTPEQMSATVTTYWGGSYPGFMMYGIISDEYLHHRGQLYCYLRLFGIEPPQNWDFEHNAPDYQPRAH